MSNDKLKFWVKCPECRKPFGVFPRLVLQYLNRLVEAHGFDAPQPQGEPKERPEKSQEAPAKPYRKGGYTPQRR
jgi:hypothetical protein